MKFLPSVNKVHIITVKDLLFMLLYSKPFSDKT